MILSLYKKIPQTYEKCFRSLIRDESEYKYRFFLSGVLHLWYSFLEL